MLNIKVLCVVVVLGGLLASTLKPMQAQPVPITQLTTSQRSDKIVYDDGIDIFVMNVDGSGIQQLTSGGDSDDPRINPNGTEIVFVSDRDGNDEIYVMDITGNNLRRLTNNNVRDFSPSWSPDGTKIAYISNMAGGFDIYVMDVDGANNVNITNSPSNERGAIWSPTMNQIAFISNQSGVYQIYTVLADGSNYSRLTYIDYDLVRFNWSPDGTRIAFYNGQNGQIHQISADGTQEAPITQDEADIGGFFWLNNQQLIFTDTVNGWVRIDLDGSNRTVVNLDWSVGNFSFPPDIQLPIPPANTPPTANAGADQMIVAANGVTAQVSLPASASDPEDEIKQLSWYEDGRGLGGGLNPHELNVELEVGVHLLTLVATDSRGLTGSDEVVIVVEVNTTPGFDQKLTVDHRSIEGTLVFPLYGNVYTIELSEVGIGGGTLLLEDVNADEIQWSPDGSRLVFTANGIYTVNADGTGLQQLVVTDDINAQPSWSPDGTKIVFSSDRDGDREIYVINTDGSDLTRLTNTPGDDGDPSWSPDGTQIVFASDRDGQGFELYIMGADGSNPTQLLTLSLHNFTPVWSPDGQWIAFGHIATLYEPAELYIARSDGSNVQKLDENLYELWYIDWLPDSSGIIYQEYTTVYTIEINGTNRTIIADFLPYRPNPGPVDLYQSNSAD